MSIKSKIIKKENGELWLLIDNQTKPKFERLKDYLYSDLDVEKTENKQAGQVAFPILEEKVEAIMLTKNQYVSDNNVGDLENQKGAFPQTIKSFLVVSPSV